MSMEAVIVLRHPALPLTLHFALHCRSGLGEQLRDRIKYTTLFLVTHRCWNFWTCPYTNCRANVLAILVLIDYHAIPQLPSGEWRMSLSYEQFINIPQSCFDKGSKTKELHEPENQSKTPDEATARHTFSSSFCRAYIQHETSTWGYVSGNHPNSGPEPHRCR